MENYTITIARGFGSGGKEIASEVAKKLGIHCYENRILTLASQLSGIDKQLFEEVNEKLRQKKSGITTLLRGLPRRSTPTPEKNKFASDDQLYDYEKQIILELYNTESSVIVGKAADWVLKDKERVLSVYIEAPRSFCRPRIMKKMGVTAETADISITETDKYRAEYYAYYTGGNYWTNPVNYDLTLNTARLGIDGCVEMIEHALFMKFPDLKTAEKSDSKY
ncbi:MAG: cytidylate kinase-like family protein [Treponema sp.]|nr:cytidylate kinase-like family protein [Spirochaetia bacterium]MDD7459479.1 cytidylate kinase-like family protein [Spirochaetales bacterium]MDY5812793.1 cytidylate kinase-like family protein [Treponema sp.]MEE1182154.1 cytidylate kinase-like family protein [Treponema sp.]